MFHITILSSKSLVVNQLIISYKKLWAKGFSSFHDLSIETPYISVYNKLWAALKESIKKLEQEHPLIKNFKVIFVGHSFGGSLAVLAAYALIHTKTVNSEVAPLVYTYGQLRIGGANFVGKVNETVKVMRIIKDNDYMTRAPQCIPSDSNPWSCYSDDSLEKAPEYRDYIMHYKNGQSVPGPVVA